MCGAWLRAKSSQKPLHSPGVEEEILPMGSVVPALAVVGNWVCEIKTQEKTFCLLFLACGGDYCSGCTLQIRHPGGWSMLGSKPVVERHSVRNVHDE